jgi:tetratricopeptide (TPR) repeat protein
MKAAFFCAVVAAALSTQAHASAFSDFNQGISARDAADTAETIRWMSLALSQPALQSHLRPAALLDRSEAYIKTKQYDLALADLTACLNLIPGDYTALMERAGLYIVKGEADHARADYTAAIQARPELPRPYAARAATYMQEHRYDDALKDYSAGIEAVSWMLEFYALRSDAYRLEARYEDALKEDNYAIGRDDKFADAYLARARVHDDAGDLKAALDDYKKTLDIDAKSIDASLFAGIAEWKLGRFDEAARDFRRGPKTSGYFFIWNYLATAKRERDHHDLGEEAAKIQTEDWPAPIVKLIAGSAQPQAVFDAAANGYGYARGDQMCEANFYVGEWKLAQGDSIGAKELLNKAAKDCQMDSPELNAAKAELGRLP